MLIYGGLLSLLLITFLIGYFTIIAYQKKLEKHLFESFKAMSFDVLQKSFSTINEQAKTLQEGAKTDLEGRKNEIEQLLSPLKEVMTKIEKKTEDLEIKREVAYQGLKTQVNHLIESEKALALQTHNLVKALRCPNVRGTWGQVHLRRVVEIAGLLNHCDFYEQKTIGGKLRPDLIVQLPGNRHIVVDAKTPLDSYLEAAEVAGEKLYLEKIQQHAKNIKRHLVQLSQKEYFKQFTCSVEYVILFLPAEAFFSSALQADPHLIETAAFQNVIIATPTTLIAILRAVGLSWKQEALSKSTEEIADLGKELYERMAILSEHWSKLGKNIKTVVDSYNTATSSLESRVLSTARKFSSLGSATEKKIKEMSFLEKAPKLFSSEELLDKK